MNFHKDLGEETSQMYINIYESEIIVPSKMSQ